jgi:hypothetical protein
MIPYSDLVAALRSWRERNGLPNFGIDPGASPSAMATPAPSLPGPPAGTGLQTRTAPPMPPPGAGGSTIEVAEEIDAQEIESEEIYENEGGDFAMAFGSNIQVATEPGAEPEGGGYGGYGGGSDDDFAAEPAPSTGTQPGVEPPGKKPGKKR